MPLDIQNLMNEIKKLNREEDCIKCEFNDATQSLTLDVMLEGRKHVPAILALCSELSMDSTLLRFSLNDIPFEEYFDLLLNFLSSVLQTNQTLQILNINALRSHRSPGLVEPCIDTASEILEHAMKSNPHLHLSSFVFSVPVEHREGSYNKYEETLSPIINNENICAMLLKNKAQQTSGYANNTSLYFSSKNSSNTNKVKPIGYEQTSESVESPCRCTIS